MDNSDKTRTSSHDSWVVWDLNGYLDGISLIKNEMANVEPETSLDKGTQRKTTENELPSLTQCTA